MSRSRFHRGAVALAAWAGSAAALAVPVAEVTPPLLADGFIVEWAQVGTSPHTIADALNALAGTGGFTVLASAIQTLDTVDLNDLSVPFAGGDPVFAIRVTGYITLDAGTYTFSSEHDDGVRLTVGGDNVIVFDSDTSPVVTTSASFTLPAGVYKVEAIGWEQGGQFEFSLNQDDGSGSVLMVGLHAIPEPATMGLAIAGLALVGAAVRRRRPG